MTGDLNTAKKTLEDLKAYRNKLLKEKENLEPTKQKIAIINGFTCNVFLRENKIGLGFASNEECEKFYNSLK